MTHRAGQFLKPNCIIKSSWLPIFWHCAAQDISQVSGKNCEAFFVVFARLQAVFSLANKFFFHLQIPDSPFCSFLKSDFEQKSEFPTLYKCTMLARIIEDSIVNIKFWTNIQIRYRYYWKGLTNMQEFKYPDYQENVLFLPTDLRVFSVWQEVFQGWRSQQTHEVSSVVGHL